MAYNPWPEIIKQYLRANDVSQSELAARGDLAAQTVNRWIHRKAVPEPDSIDKLAKGMGRSVDELMWQYTRALDAHYRPRVEHLLDGEPRAPRRSILERAEALLDLDLSGLWHDMKLALGGMRDAIRNAISSHEASKHMLETLISRYEDSYEAALKKQGLESPRRPEGSPAQQRGDGV